MILRTFITIGLSSLAIAQVLVPLDSPTTEWTQQIPPSNQGNECAVYATDTVLICTTSSGATVGLLPGTGDEIWRHEPTSKTQDVQFSNTGIAFGSNTAIGDFMIHAVSEGGVTTDPSFW